MGWVVLEVLAVGRLGLPQRGTWSCPVLLLGHPPPPGCSLCSDIFDF